MSSLTTHTPSPSVSAERLADVRVRRLEGAGWWATLTHPQEVLRELADFLQEPRLLEESSDEEEEEDDNVDGVTRTRHQKGLIGLLGSMVM